MEELPLLIKLQEHDSLLDEMRDRAEAIEPQIKSTHARLAALQTGLKSAKEKLSTHLLKRKQLEAEAEAQEKLVQKHQAELNSLKSNDAYKAMLSEIQAAKDAVVKIEDGILVVMEALETDEKDYKEREKKFKSDEAGIKSEIQALEAAKAAILAEREKKKEERDAFAKTVPPVLVSQYDAIREKRDGIAIVPMVNNACSGCRMAMTPARANEVKAGRTMVLCESCIRILYNPPEEKPAPLPVPTSSAAS